MAVEYISSESIHQDNSASGSISVTIPADCTFIVLAATITANTDVTIYGVGIVGGGSAATTKANAAGGGTLLASASFTSAKTLANNETLDITYTLSAANS